MGAGAVGAGRDCHDRKLIEGGFSFDRNGSEADLHFTDANPNKLKSFFHYSRAVIQSEALRRKYFPHETVLRNLAYACANTYLYVCKYRNLFVMYV